jgi:AcrR family transcriptional regulator
MEVLMKGGSGKGAATRLRIIRTAADLFHKQGVVATSPDEIIEASGIGKGQFYYYFKNKEGLVHEVLQTYLNEIETNTAPFSREIMSWEELEGWFVAQIELQRRFQPSAPPRRWPGQ